MCDRGHSKSFRVSRLIGNGTLKSHCCFILGYRMREGIGQNAMECGDLPMGDKLPSDYKSLGNITV